MKPLPQRVQAVASLVVALASVAFFSATAKGQNQVRLLPATQPATQITIDESILAAFVDKPCEHFEAARDRFAAGEWSQAAEQLRTASAFLQLESARANEDGQPALNASIRELGELATAIEKGQVGSLDTLQMVFARAHFALASHHCIKSSHRCCQLESTKRPQDAERAGHDLRAAATHFERGSMWKYEELDEESRQAIQVSRRAADRLTEKGERLQIGETKGSLTEVMNGIHKLHFKLESLTGRRIRLASPREIDPSIPSAFR